MKHSIKITLILLTMFFVAQLVGILVVHNYASQTIQVLDENNQTVNVTTHNLPYGMEPPKDVTPKISLFSIILSIAIAVSLMLILMRFKAQYFLRGWFFFVVTLALGIAINSFILGVKYGTIISLIIALPLAFIKIFRQNIIVHNLTELLIYPGIASIIVPLLSVPTVAILLILISIYDIYAVWHAGFMQKMAKYQINELKIFSGFFIPYVGKKDRELIRNARRNSNLKSLKKKKIKVNLAILGGGDVVFPIILAGTVLMTFGLLPALIVSICATIALAGLFYMSQKGNFYPAMPFISAGCFVALGIIYIFFR